MLHPLAVDLRQLVGGEIGALVDGGEGQPGDATSHPSEDRDVLALDADEVLRAQIGPAGTGPDDQQGQDPDEQEPRPPPPVVAGGLVRRGGGDWRFAAFGDLRPAGGAVSDPRRRCLRGLGCGAGDDRHEHRALLALDGVGLTHVTRNGIGDERARVRLWSRVLDHVDDRLGRSFDRLRPGKLAVVDDADADPLRPDPLGHLERCTDHGADRDEQHPVAGFAALPVKQPCWSLGSVGM